jgi:hypothetical protein
LLKNGPAPRGAGQVVSELPREVSAPQRRDQLSKLMMSDAETLLVWPFEL